MERTQVYFKDGLNTLFGRASKTGLDLRVFDSKFPGGSTYSADLDKTQLTALREDIGKVLRKELSEATVSGMEPFWFDENRYLLSFTRSKKLGHWGHLLAIIKDNNSKTYLKVDVNAQEFLGFIEKLIASK